MLAVNSSGHIVKLTKRPNPKNAINRYCHLDPKHADINKSSPCYMFTYPNQFNSDKEQ